MKNFNWSNYIGEHMDEPLRVKPNKFKFKNTEPVLSYGIIGNDYRIECSQGVYTNDEIKPLIKSISDLTDDELLFVFGYNKDTIITIFKTNAYLEFFIKGYSFCKYYFDGGKFNFKNRILDHQQILNRLYSLHVSLYYEELIKNGLAVRKP